MAGKQHELDLVVLAGAVETLAVLLRSLDMKEQGAVIFNDPDMAIMLNELIRAAQLIRERWVMA